MNDVVWISRAPLDSNVAKSLRHDALEQDPNSVADIARRIMAGEVLDSELFPKEMYYTPDEGRSAALPDFFKGGGFWIVSKRFADVIASMDPGNCRLHEVGIFYKDSLEPVGGRYFCINFGNVKSALLPDQSNGLRPAPGGKWKLRPICEDGDLAVSSLAKAGADIWIDPALPLTFFLSDRLVKALKEANADSGLGGYIPLKKCRVI